MSAIIKHTVQNPIEVASAAKGSTDPFDKLCKMFNSAVNFSGAVAKVSTGANLSEPVTNFAGQLKIFSGLAGATNIIPRITEWGCPTTMTVGKQKVSDYRCRFDKKCSGKKLVTNEKGVTENVQKNVFKDDGYWSLTKTISQVFLTIAHAIEFVRFGEVIGLVAYGAASSILGIVKSIVYIPASTFGIIAGSSALKESKYHRDNVAAKVNGWFDKLGGQDENDFKKDELLAHYDAKLATRKVEIVAENDVKKKGALQEKINKYTQFILEIGNVDDGEKIGADTKFHQYCTVKLEGWEKSSETAKSNKGKANTKTWLGIAGDVGKLALGIIGLVGLFVGIATNPWFVITVSIGWFATYTLGLTKWLYGNFNKVEDIKAPIPSVEFVKV